MPEFITTIVTTMSEIITTIIITIPEITSIIHKFPFFLFFKKFVEKN